MNNVILCSGNSSHSTCIPNRFIEDYMFEASGSYVKLYIYLSKCIQCGDSQITISYLADKMEATERDVLRGLLYWENKGLLQIARNRQGQITAIDMLDNLDTISWNYDTEKLSSDSIKAYSKSNNISNNNEAKSSDIRAKSSDIRDKSSNIRAKSSNIRAFENNESNVRTEYIAPDVKSSVASTSSETTVPAAKIVLPVLNEFENSTSNANNAAGNDFTSNANVENNDFTSSAESEADSTAKDDGVFNWICIMVESYLNHPLSSNEQELISYLYEELHFDSDRILQLYEYCIGLGKTNTSYIRTVAINWDKSNIHTASQAKDMFRSYNSIYNEVAKAFSLNRLLAPVEQEFVNKWHEIYHFDIGMIREACNKTILTIKEPDFKYTDGIMGNWHSAGITSLQDVKNADETYNNKQKEHNKSHAKSVARIIKPVKKNQFNSYKQRPVTDTQMADLEKRLLQQSIGGGGSNI